MTNHRRALPFRSLAVRDILRRAGGRCMVVVAPHPDDETLGCGSLIAAAVRRRVAVGVIALTDGDASHPGSLRWPPAALGRLRAAEMRRALARLGAGGASVRRFGWRDGDVDRDADVRRLRAQLVALGAGVVLVTSDADHHPDHRAAMRVTAAAARGLRIAVVRYAVWSRSAASRPRPSRYRAVKAWAMGAHRSQVSDYVADDPGGFRLTPATLARLIGGAENYLMGF